MNWKQQLTRDIVRKALAEGLRVWVAQEGKGTYGFYTDDTGKRVVSFQIDFTVRFSGNYKSDRCGTGWMIQDDMPATLRELLSAYPFQGITFTRFTTVEDHLKTYGPSSRYMQVTELPDENLQEV